MKANKAGSGTKSTVKVSVAKNTRNLKTKVTKFVAKFHARKGK